MIKNFLDKEFSQALSASTLLFLFSIASTLSSSVLKFI